MSPREAYDWNEYNLNPLTSNDWRASLVPAAAVIPAPIAYIKVVAVKKLVVGFRKVLSSPPLRGAGYWPPMFLTVLIREGGESTARIVYFEEIRVFKAGVTRLRIR